MKCWSSQDTKQPDSRVYMIRQTHTTNNMITKKKPNFRIPVTSKKPVSNQVVYSALVTSNLQPAPQQGTIDQVIIEPLVV